MHNLKRQHSHQIVPYYQDNLVYNDQHLRISKTMFLSLSTKAYPTIASPYPVAQSKRLLVAIGLLSQIPQPPYDECWNGREILVNTALIFVLTRSSQP